MADSINSKPALCEVAQRCGGCPGLVVGDYREGLIRKVSLIEEACRTLPLPSAVKLGEAPKQIAYRRRIRLCVDEGRVRFFNPEKSHQCIVLTDGLRQLINCLFTVSLREPLLFNGATHLDVRDKDLDGMYGVTVFGEPKNREALRRTLADALIGFGDDSTVPMQRIALCGSLSHRVPLTSFMQINAEVNAQVQADLWRHCQEEPPENFWDLYSGVGNLSLKLAADGFEGGGEELNPQSVAAANQTLHDWGQPKRYLSSDARLPNERRPRTVALLIANPPRAGLREGVRLIGTMRPRRVFLMSCDVKAFARDLTGILGFGYEIERVDGYDMFPHTDHVEVTALLRRC